MARTRDAAWNMAIRRAAHRFILCKENDARKKIAEAGGLLAPPGTKLGRRPGGKGTHVLGGRDPRAVDKKKPVQPMWRAARAEEALVGRCNR